MDALPDTISAGEAIPWLVESLEQRDMMQKSELYEYPLEYHYMSSKGQMDEWHPEK